MDFKQLVDAAENWCSGNPFDLIFAEELDERRLDFYAEPGISFYVLCPDAATGGADTFHVWSESEDCLPFLQMAQDYISSCGKKTLVEVLDKVFRSFRPVSSAREYSQICSIKVGRFSAVLMHGTNRQEDLANACICRIDRATTTA
uniref:Maturin n=1 Tax=Denticeps clupeoides TaxID=299321 RepID=A0AAY4E2V2_9TELE